MAIPSVRKVVICGFGLIGGSIALDLQRFSRSMVITAFDRPGVLRKIASVKRFRVQPQGNFKRAVADADIVVLSATHSANEEMLARLAAMTSLTDTLIIDTGAVKAKIARLGRILPFAFGTQFVPSHPMAGKEKAGFENAEPGIFKSRTWFIDDQPHLTPENSRRLNWLIKATGAVPVYIESELHDDLVAEISHLPQLLSTMLGAQVNEKTINLSGPGLRSMLRLAGSPYSVWSEIIDQNRDNIVEVLNLYRENLETITKMIQQKQSLKEIFAAAARSYRCLS